jgi:predicted enzyme related to lactoylglutathione lyase
MSCPVVHFEIGSADAATLAPFYEAVFGWSFAPLGAARSLTGGHEGGPSGMLNALGHPPETYVMVYVEVPDMAAALARVESAGGTRMVGPIPLPNGRHFAWIHDTAGNLVGLLTPAPAVG